MSSATSTPAKAPKTMSSKLLTMKFMQRAAASSPISTPSTPNQLTPTRPNSGDSPSLNVDVQSLADQRAVQAAVAAEEAKRQAALERQAADAGDTRWVLNFKQDINDSSNTFSGALRVIQTGFAAIDHGTDGGAILSYIEDESLERPTIVGRRSYGKFNRTVEVWPSRRSYFSATANPKYQKLQDPTAESSSESESEKDEDNEPEDSSDDNDYQDPTDALVQAARQEAAKKLKAERRAKRKAAEAESRRLAEQRKKKDIKLNTLTSISNSPITCHKCGERGHVQAKCPEAKRGRDHHEEDENRPRKSRKSK